MNKVVLAVAGGRKTQSVVDECQGCPANRRVLVLGYTVASQDELARRIRGSGVLDRRVEVMGWFSFLMQHAIRPYLPMLYSGHRLSGLNFDGEPARGRYAKGVSRFLDPDDRAYKLHVAKLAHDVLTTSNGAVINRLEYIYDAILIDEVQDLGGWDLDVVEALLRSNISITMVGDMRQALLSTNIRDPKNKQYRREKIFDWFELMARRGLLEIEQAPTTYRSNQMIATFSDSIFDPTLGYEATVSASAEIDPHVGLFVVRPGDVKAYFESFDPLCLRHSVTSGKAIDLPFVTFGVAKGRTVDHVLIHPTEKISGFIMNGGHLEGGSACSLYIGVTRARHSVTFITSESPNGFTAWTPPAT